MESIVSILPPLITLAVALATRHIIAGLVCGIVSAALIATNASLMPAVSLMIDRFIANTDFWRLSSPALFWQSSNLFTLLFLIALAIIVTLIGHSGGAYAYSTWAKKFIVNEKTTLLAAAVLSIFLSIDDYFSSLTVGSVMQPVTDRYKIPRIKLSFFVDSLAAPLAILCPFSSWIAGIVGFLHDNGIGNQCETGVLIAADPFMVYLHTWPFLFYSFLALIGCLFIALYPISFGYMHEHELIAEKSGNLFGGKQSIKSFTAEAPASNIAHAHLIDFLYPTGVLLITTICALLASGDFFLFGGTQSFWHALQHTNAPKALFMSGATSLIFTTIFFVLRKKVRLREMLPLYVAGTHLMLPTLCMLLCAWTLGDILRLDLHTGAYIGSLIPMLPVSVVLLAPLLFLVALFTSFSIGSSWATMAIMLPIAIPLLTSVSHLNGSVMLGQVPMLSIMLGAVFSGAVAGNHVSPLADTTLMSARSSGAYLTDHFKAQLVYALPMIIGAVCGFLVASLMITYGIFAAWLSGIFTAVSLMICVLMICNHFSNKV